MGNDVRDVGALKPTPGLNADAGVSLPTDGGLPIGGLPVVPSAADTFAGSVGVMPPALKLSEEQRQALVWKKGTCPGIGSAVAQGLLPVYGTVDNPLVKIEDVRRLFNTNGGDLGSFVASVFATGNHARMLGSSGELDTPVPKGPNGEAMFFSFNLPGSQGAHPGHSGILMGDPHALESNRTGPGDPRVLQNFNRLIARATDGRVKCSDVGKFIAENLLRDPNATVLGKNHTFSKLFGDLRAFVESTGPAILSKIESGDSNAQREHVQKLTKLLGEDNLIGSCGEFGLFFAFVANQPGARKIDGEPTISVDDLRSMFISPRRLPPNWETGKETVHDWAIATTRLIIAASKDYRSHQVESTWQRVLNWFGF